MERLERVRGVARELGGKLPRAYEEVFLWINEVLATSDMSENQRGILLEDYFMVDADDLRRVNAFVRQGDARWTEAISEWPSHYLVFGDDSCGGYYYIDISGESQECTVGYYEHETPEFVDTGETPREYVEERIGAIKEEYK